MYMQDTYLLLKTKFLFAFVFFSLKHKLIFVSTIKITPKAYVFNLNTRFTFVGTAII